MKDEIIIYWFKRDLRLSDNDAFHHAIDDHQDFKILLLYIYEPSLLSNPHYSHRHWQFVQESLNDLNLKLKSHNTKIHIVKGEVLTIFKVLSEKFNIKKVISTEETGLDITYQRDLLLKDYFNHNKIIWKEFQNNGVIRGIKNRNGWRDKWYKFMSKEIKQISIEKGRFTELDFSKENLNISFIYKVDHYHQFQKGGRSEGKKWEDSFFNERIEYYSQFISKPEQSRYGCSRLSPYHSWGCISIREVYQRNLKLRDTSDFKKQLSAHRSRLRWQSHFIQKFEQEPRMEFEAINKGYLKLDQPKNEKFVKAWKSGKTGYPLVDASIRCLEQSGYLNFRMRTMISSFLHHHLDQNFKEGSFWLARQFLDFEPGIHYAQLQMQAGLTGTNTIRIYNPTKNAIDHDPDAKFIKRWVPELRDLPIQFAIEPWKMNEINGIENNFKLKTAYPPPLVDIKETRKASLAKLYALRKDELTKHEKHRILETHTLKRNYGK